MSKRPVLVLGARSDIGLAIAHRLAAAGHPIQLAARQPAALETDRGDMALRHGVEVTTHAYDALELDAIDDLFVGLPAQPGIVVCVIGLLGDQAETEGNAHKARFVVETNFLGPALVLEAAAQRLAALDEATAIVGISSVAGDRGRAKNYWYGASKAGFTAALSGLRQKYARSRLHVMTVKPGFVATKMTEGMDLIGPLTAQPDDIAKLVQDGLRRRRQVITPFRWWVVMSVIRAVPEKIFMKMKF